MFKGLGDLASLMKNLHHLRQQLDETKEQLRQTRVQGSAGGGMVVVEANGQQEVLSCQISPDLFDQHDRELLEDLVTAAANQALEQSRKAAQEQMAKALGGLPIPGLTEALSQLTNPANP